MTLVRSEGRGGPCAKCGKDLRMWFLRLDVRLAMNQVESGVGGAGEVEGRGVVMAV